jgi:hypothetical protein
MDDERLSELLESFPERKQLDAILSKFVAPGKKWRLFRIFERPIHDFCPVYEISIGTRPDVSKMTPEAYNAAHAGYKPISNFSLCQFPGCCGIMISYHATVYNPYLKLGLGTILNKLRIHLAKCEGYTYLMATDIVENEPQRKILAKNGWEDLLTFTNRRTQNLLALSIIKL